MSIDVKKKDNNWVIYSDNGSKESSIELKNYLKIIEECGAGEILINSIDKDGSARGFDEELLNFVNDNTSLPKIFCGAGSSNDFIKILQKKNVSLATKYLPFQRVELSKHKKKILESNIKLESLYLILIIRKIRPIQKIR